MKWWSYLHINGTVQSKRYFEPLDIQEAWESPFVERVTAAYDAESRDEAQLKGAQLLGVILK